MTRRDELYTENEEWNNWRLTKGQDYPEQIAHIKYAEKIATKQILTSVRGKETNFEKAMRKYNEKKENT